MPRGTRKLSIASTKLAGPYDRVPSQCGLCGATENLTRIPCCGNWICDDATQYVMFSFASNSCYRNHEQFTLCAYHHHEGHVGLWPTCAECRESFEPEMYAWYGTNEYNFRKLEHPAAYAPTRCTSYGTIIRLAVDGYVINRERGYLCRLCAHPPGLRCHRAPSSAG